MATVAKTRGRQKDIDGQIKEARQKLEAAKRERAKAVAAGADPLEASAAVRDAADALEALLEGAEEVRHQLQRAEQKEERQKAKGDLDALLAEIDRLVDGYDAKMDTAVAAAEEYVEKASEALSERGRLDHLATCAKVLADWYGFDLPEIPRLPIRKDAEKVLHEATQMVEEAPHSSAMLRRLRLQLGRTENAEQRQRAEEGFRRHIEAAVEGLKPNGNGKAH